MLQFVLVVTAAFACSSACQPRSGPPDRPAKAVTLRGMQHPATYSPHLAHVINITLDHVDPKSYFIWLTPSNLRFVTVVRFKP
jgi:hypothetical protein